MAGSPSSQDLYHLSTSPRVLEDCDRCVLSDKRLFYLYSPARRSYWEPPLAAWTCSFGLPYGYERAIDEFGTSYYVNHIRQETSYEDPRCLSNGLTSGAMPPTARVCHLSRSPDLGFGFVAASEKPVVIQFVTPGGPSDGRLLPNDQILQINDQDVRYSDKNEVVDMIRSAQGVLKLTVAQKVVDSTENTTTPRKVRFTERVCVAGSPVELNSLTILPNVFRVYLENGQTKSFKYNSFTTVNEVIQIFVEKLNIKEPELFALATEQPITLSPAKLHVLRNSCLIEKMINESSSSRLRFRLRVVFPTRDVIAYSVDDPTGFEYFYHQCVNDFVDGRFVDMRYEACLRLAALHIRQVWFDSKGKRRVDLNKIERDYGLATFLPTIWLEKVRKKEVRKHLRFFLRKDDHGFDSLKSLSKQKSGYKFNEDNNLSNILRIKYVTILSHLPGFGGKSFRVSYKPTNMDMIMQIDPSVGLVVRYPGKTTLPAMTINLDLLESIYICPETDSTKLLTLKLAPNTNSTPRNLEFVVEKEDSEDFSSYILGYTKVLCGKEIECHESDVREKNGNSAPEYRGIHFVCPAGWNYSMEANQNQERTINLAMDPPVYEQAMLLSATYPSPDLKLLENKNYAMIGKKEELSTYIDENSSPIDSNSRLISPKGSNLNMRRPSQQQRLKELLVGTASSFWSHRNKKFRDSLRVHRQRHSIPNGQPATATTTVSFEDRRWSAIPPHPGHLNAPFRVNEVNNMEKPRRNSESRRPFSLRLIKNTLPISQVLSPLSRKSTYPQQKKPLEQVRRAFSLDEERKHVRFDFSCNLIHHPPPSPTPSLDTLTGDVEASTRAFVTLKDFDTEQSFEFISTSKLLPTSQTFPMDSRGLNGDFTEDFVPRSYQQPNMGVNPQKPNIRRMSLKEFSGLEEATKPDVPRHNSSTPYCTDSPLLHRLHSMSISSQQSNYSAFLEKYNYKRHSSVGIGRISISPGGIRRGSREHTCDPFDKTIDEINLQLDRLQEHSTASQSMALNNEPLTENLIDVSDIEDSDAVNAVLYKIKSRLSKSIDKVPNESPKRRFDVGAEKVYLLQELIKLSSICKTLIKAVNSVLEQKDRLQAVSNVLRSTDRVINLCESFLGKSNSIYQAQLLNAKADQMLNSLSDVLNAVFNAFDKPRFSDEAKHLNRMTTSLTATLTQLAQTVPQL
ncbi:unnamed protein product [Bursaphelenchus xylophilus]|uniref:(pine wood nematode) hypothetical protein n=1 Tax=Bursaphelenchus xylophilus TaxID=6326 RepID=A0A1I7SUH5_BURXY|nr:unnamed protein product [Bursaphelenchus xylophilus]CAG9107124.1 unnamed protein product [Bursaphelenchus xylophilus]